MQLFPFAHAAEFSQKPSNRPSNSHKGKICHKIGYGEMGVRVAAKLFILSF